MAANSWARSGCEPVSEMAVAASWPAVATVSSRMARSRWPLAMTAAVTATASRMISAASAAVTDRMVRRRCRMCSPISESLGSWRMVAARSATASWNRGSAARRLPA